jgi:hypothetical protein
MGFRVHTRVHGTSRGMYRTALIFGKPLKITKLIETAGLMWAPDVPPHTVKAKITPLANPRPIWSTAENKIHVREFIAPVSKGRTRRVGLVNDVSHYPIHLRS